MRALIERGKHKDGSEIKYISYMCGNYRRSGKIACTYHGIYEKVLIELVVEHIRKHAKMVEYNEKLIIEAILSAQNRETTSYRAAYQSELEENKKLISKLDKLIENLYEDRVTGIIMPGWIEKRSYIDNGASGGNFNRQGFQDMMEDVRSGIINLVLVQDLSRFGRNYLETGRYLEEELPSRGCRFVALSDGIDTETGDNDIMPFLNAMNDYYLKPGRSGAVNRRRASFQESHHVRTAMPP